MQKSRPRASQKTTYKCHHIITIRQESKKVYIASRQASGYWMQKHARSLILYVTKLHFMDLTTDLIRSISLFKGPAGNMPILFKRSVIYSNLIQISYQHKKNALIYRNFQNHVLLFIYFNLACYYFYTPSQSKYLR